jgi:hypothetical protein
MPEQESGVENIAHKENLRKFLGYITIEGDVLVPRAEEARTVSGHLKDFSTEELREIMAKADQEMEKAKDECLIPMWYLKIAEEVRNRGDQN